MRARIVITVIAFSLSFPLGWKLTHSSWSAVASFADFIGTLAALHVIWLPRIVRRRLEAELGENPVRAIARRRKERRAAIIGWTLGVTSGTLGLLAGLWFGR